MPPTPNIPMGRCPGVKAGDLGSEGARELWELGERSCLIVEGMAGVQEIGDGWGAAVAG